MLRILHKINFSAALELGKLPLKTTAKPGNSSLSWGVMLRLFLVLLRPPP
jgi:hypothetical protein